MKYFILGQASLLLSLHAEETDKDPPEKI